MGKESNIELTILMPCLNEAETLLVCIEKAKNFLSSRNIAGEVLIADNGSKDGSQEIATKAGARVVNVPKKGYGAALIKGIKEALGTFVIMGDADDSYDFSQLDAYVKSLREGSELVMGNRFKGGIKKGAMPFIHRYLGNPVLSFIGRLFFNVKIGDFHCGLRGFKRDSILALKLKTTGMEFASEMVVKAALFSLKIDEVPTILAKDGRSRPPHLRTWRDGWRHLRFLLLYSPGWLFFYPGLVFFMIGICGIILISRNPVTVGKVTFDIHTLLYSSFSVIIGFQSILFYVLSKTFAINLKLTPDKQRFTKLWKIFDLEIGLIAGAILILTGFGFSIYSVIEWKNASYGVIDPTKLMRYVIPATTVLILGIQFVFFSFFLSILGIRTSDDE